MKRTLLLKLLFLLVVGSTIAACDPDAGACEELAADPGCLSEPLEGDECEVDGADECSACYRDALEGVGDDCSGVGDLDAQCTSACETYRSSR